MKRTGPTNIHLRLLISKLRKYSRMYNAPVWRDVAEFLERPRRKRVEVNLGDIDRYINEGDVVVVPGKLLGGGTITKTNVTIAAWRFSRSVPRRLDGNVKLLSIEELLEQNPEGKGVKIIA
ncbi:MAG: 50S ribosomal protein L18e [Thermofilum sp.]|jgi:large subunit ribosomal protein L18e|uniref:Large ribosomal subunit protein eL18 n=2 Tax=Thermofilum adornatum TaxID=1365176 RepID=S5ZCW4_9CREN|nr:MULTISPECIES: 50S ribosomal protein L18e [Thermofilum]AGT34848.1 50S ribosomal protein L18 [Thermofilum adornatum]AJB42578.1 LSU ribosomal protein L18e [Thermofilum adornatum 1505]MCI4408972.1 50S ribosomal protein L18e [Thermofilum sp.]NAZ25654.1 50S ribosomal protein L18e [Thermofilum sp.]